jgi:hypothetical protein
LEAGVDPKLAAEYSKIFGKTQIDSMRMKTETGLGEPEALPVTAGELKSVGMLNAASQIESRSLSRNPTPNVQPAL